MQLSTYSHQYFKCRQVLTDIYKTVFYWHGLLFMFACFGTLICQNSQRELLYYFLCFGSCGDLVAPLHFLQNALCFPYLLICKT